jgi:DNA-binding PadR family transcriptional regulator
MPEARSNRLENKNSALSMHERRGKVAEDARSPVAWLVLALVIEQPSHGYEISQRYDERFGAFAALSAPRVYAALDRLRDAGMIEAVVLESAKPVRKQHLMRRSYRSTPAGLKAYRNWVAERMRDDPQRPQLLARIASAGSLGLDAVLAVIDRYERSCVEELRTLPTDSERVEVGDSSLEEITQYLVTDQQRRELRARHEWAVHARGIVRAHMQRTAAETGGDGSDGR